MKSTNGIQALMAAALIGTAGAAGATSPVEMTYTVTGTANDWTLDFDVANNLVDSDHTVYFVGVAVDGGSVAGSPATFDPNAVSAPWSSNFVYGGSSLTYDAVWYSGDHLIASGTDLDGFLVHSSAVDAPTSVNWFVFTSGSEYTGSGHFGTGYNSGWEGVATAQVSVVPEPANVALLLAGLGICGFAARRRASAR